MSFSQQGPRTVCILSANGSICNVTLRQPASTGGTVTYEVCTFSPNILLPENIPLGPAFGYLFPQRKRPCGSRKGKAFVKVLGLIPLPPVHGEQLNA